MLPPVSCILPLRPTPFQCSVCVCVRVCTVCALFVPVPVGGAHKICTILHFDICMRRHVVAFIYPSVWGQLSPPNHHTFLSLSLPLNAPAPGQPCTSINNNSQAQKTEYFQYDVVSITVILPYMPLSCPSAAPCSMPSKRT